jgi:hypothetical protein
MIPHMFSRQFWARGPQSQVEPADECGLEAEVAGAMDDEKGIVEVGLSNEDLLGTPGWAIERHFAITTLQPSICYHYHAKQTWPVERSTVPRTNYCTFVPSRFRLRCQQYDIPSRTDQPYLL